jgi:hypothetical protein
MQIIPQYVTDAAASLTTVGTDLESAVTTATPGMTAITPMGADEVSAAISALFSGHGLDFLGAQAQASSFQQQFIDNLSASAVSYIGADSVAQNSLRTAIDTYIAGPLYPYIYTTLLQRSPGPANIIQPPIPTNVNPITLTVGGTGGPVLPVDANYGLAYLYGFQNPYSVFTPEQLWPTTPNLGNLSLNQSVALGTGDLNTALMTQIAAGNHVTVWGTSQGAVVESETIKQLMANGSPGADQVKFILTGNPESPDGGFMTRLVGGYIPLADITAYGATPPNSPYTVVNYTNQYDGVADWPRYPLNLVSDSNAVAGFLFGAHDYGIPYNPQQLPTSPGYTGNTTYYLDLEQNLPLVTPLREFVPAPYGNAIADLLQPDLRVISDMGYGSGDYADLSTPASFFEIPNPTTIIPDLIVGAQQGPTAALVDLGFLPSSQYPHGYPIDPMVDPSLNFPLPQTPTNGFSLITTTEGQLMTALGLRG